MRLDAHDGEACSAVQPLWTLEAFAVARAQCEAARKRRAGARPPGERLVARLRAAAALNISALIAARNAPFAGGTHANSRLSSLAAVDHFAGGQERPMVRDASGFHLIIASPCQYDKTRPSSQVPSSQGSRKEVMATHTQRPRLAGIAAACRPG